MRRIKRFLRRIISDPHLWIIYILAVGFLLWHLLHALGWVAQEAPHDGLLLFTTVGILTLVGDRLWEGEQIKEQAQENTKKLAMISQVLLDKRIALRSRPSESEDYAYLWGEYTGNYRVYNPSYRVDTIVNEDEIVKILLDRYRNPNFKEARYVFLTGDKAGQDDLSRFCELMKRVKQACPDVARKVRVREVKTKESSSACEIYLGTRYGRDRAVMELKEPVLGAEHGMPHYYLIIDDKDVVEHYLKNHFEPAWNDKSAEDRDIFSGG